MPFRAKIGGLFSQVFEGGRKEENLLHVLRTWQIFFIALTAVIGTGAFNDFARAARTAGPAGLLVAIVMVGLVAAAFMEALSEMLQVLRTVNPLVEYVHVFVDPALARCVAGVYWFSYASFLAVQLVTAANYLSEDISTGLSIAILFVIAPFSIGYLNVQQVRYYAWLETIFGGVKLLLVLGISMILIYIAGSEHGAPFITQGFKPGKAFSLILQNVAFSFLGIESIAVMSYEARDKAALKNASQILAWVPLVFYTVFAIALAMCFDWNDDQLEIPPFGSANSSMPSKSAVLLAVAKLGSGHHALMRACTGILVFCALSAANTTLFISSRTLYGSAINETYRKWLKAFRKVNKSRVPQGAVIFSGFAFCLWLPFVSLSPTITAGDIIDWFSFTGSIGVLFTWGTTCLAYLRYWYWLNKFKNELETSPKYRKYNRWDRNAAHYFTPTAYFHFQPGVAIIGLLGCIFFVLVSPSAYWWGSLPTAAQFFRYYLLHLVVVICWLTMKAWEFSHRPRDESYWPWVKIDDRLETLWLALDSFKYLESAPNKDDEEIEPASRVPSGTQCTQCGQTSRAPRTLPTYRFATQHSDH